MFFTSQSQQQNKPGTGARVKGVHDKNPQQVKIKTAVMLDVMSAVYLSSSPGLEQQMMVHERHQSRARKRKSPVSVHHDHTLHKKGGYGVSLQPSVRSTSGESPLNQLLRFN
jgi:hypothetical protein